MSRRNTTDFQTIHSEGGLLPPDLLRRLLDPKEKIPGTQPEDYGLPKGERINEVITQSWNRLRRHWTEFRNAATQASGEASSDHSPLATHDSPSSPLATRYSPLTSLTNDKWSLPLLRELGFGLLPASAGPELDGRTYAINRFFSAAAIHLVGCGVDLDRRAAGVRGAAAANPHGLVQEFLNRSQSHLWAIVSNGLCFRILRDNQALSRQSYLEFDLESMFNGEVYADFVLLWLTAHASRFMAAEDGKPESCLLEQWTKVANEQGARALESLRGGVERALQVLGQGFVGHPRNTSLREALRSGQLTLNDFHGQLLRVVYRLIFLFVAEDRTLDSTSLLHPRDESETGRQAREHYAAHYSTTRLRDLAARIRGSRHGDLWQQFNLLVGALSGVGDFETVRRNLALPALGSLLWSKESTSDLNAASLAGSDGTELTNADFLDALRHLAFTRQDKILRPVDYKNLGSDEFGGIYESFLALTPQLSGDGARFSFAEFAGNERKTSGSYYTPDCLVQCLLDSALDPVVEERLETAVRIARYEWRVVEEEIQKNQEVNNYINSILPRLGSMATWDETGRDGIRDNEGVSKKIRGNKVRPFSAHNQKKPTETEGTSHIESSGENDDRWVKPHTVRLKERADITCFRCGCLMRIEDALFVLHRYEANSIAGRPMVYCDACDREYSSGISLRIPLKEFSYEKALLGHWTAPSTLKIFLELASCFDYETGPKEDITLFLEGESASEEKDGSSSGTSGNIKQKTTGIVAQPAEEKIAKLWNSTPLATRHSLLTEYAVLGMLVCDTACGSGHFIVGAAHRLARHLSRVRALALGESEPSPSLYQHALRDVIGRCLYGVDINPMAVELCKVTLWLEALEPGMPLSFLDHHIQCGNSLIGATPELMEQGIPDEAFTPIEGDDRAYCTKYKKRNKEERSQMELDEYAAWEHLGNLPAAIAKLDSLKDDTIDGIQEKQRRYEAFVHSTDYVHARFLADAWCAAFVWPKRDNKALPYPITNKVLRQIERNPQSIHDFTPWLREEIQRLARQYNFFHWHLAFPEVFPSSSSIPHSEFRIPNSNPRSGFDVLLGNPPWERVKLQEKEWFAERSPEIANAPNAAARKRMINKLVENDPALYQAFQDDLRKAEGESHFMRNSGKYPLCGRGDINVYTIFAELNRELTGPGGRVGCILPSGIATDDTTKFFFQDLMDTASLASLYSFENEEFIFPGIHHATRFCLLTLRASSPHSPLATRLSPPSDFVFFARQVSYLKEPDRHFALSAEDIALLNPNTRTCPIFRSKADAELTKAIYHRVPVLIKEARDGQPEENPWGITFNRMFDMANDSHLFRTREQLETDGWHLDGNIFRKDDQTFLPLYEAKMIHHYDHRWGTYEGQTQAQANQGKLPELDENMHREPNLFSLPRYWVVLTEVDARLNSFKNNRWLIGWRDITGATVLRTTITSLMPRAGVGHTCPLMFPSPNDIRLCICLLANMSSFILDYVSRQKIGGTHLTYGYMNQLPVLVPDDFWKPLLGTDQFSVSLDWLLPRILELTYTAWDLEPFAQDCGWNGPPFRWDEERRFQLRCELDAAFFHLYLPAEASGEWRVAREAGTDASESAPADETGLSPLPHPEKTRNTGTDASERSETGLSLFPRPAFPAPYGETPKQLAELKKHFPTPRHAVDYIMDTFPIIKRKDEAAHGHYRTKDTILDIYDAMQRAIATREPYQTRLDPPPADPRCCHPEKETYG